MKLDEYQENTCFSGVEWKEDKLSGVEFIDCKFENCTFENSTINSCTFTDCIFIGCHISNLTAAHTTVNNAEFRNCCLTGINWKEWTFSGSYIGPIRRLQDCRLKYNIFEEHNFAKFDFSTNTITASMFAACNLSGSQFVNCPLERTEFFRCNLAKADFRHATGYAVDLSSNQLEGAKFSFPEVVNLLNSLNIVIE